MWNIKTLDQRSIFCKIHIGVTTIQGISFTIISQFATQLCYFIITTEPLLPLIKCDYIFLKGEMREMTKKNFAKQKTSTFCDDCANVYIVLSRPLLYLCIVMYTRACCAWKWKWKKKCHGDHYIHIYEYVYLLRLFVVYEYKCIGFTTGNRTENPIGMRCYALRCSHFYCAYF